MAEKYGLPTDDGEMSSEGPLLGRNMPARKKTSTTRAIAVWSAKVVAAVSMLGILAYLVLSVQAIGRLVHLHPTGVEFGDCGSSKTVEEARAKGCKFDPMSWLWVRPECYDAELIDDFMNRTNWSWHTDWHLSAETQVPLDVVFSGEHPQLFTTKNYHAIHCTYMWEKMHKALVEHRPVDTDLTSWHHTKHCNKVLLNDLLHEDVECTPDMICPTLVRATWTSCGHF